MGDENLLKKNHVVQHVARGADKGTGVVKWTGFNANGQQVVVVRWDGPGNHILHTRDQLRVATIALKAYDRLEYERRTDTSSPNHEKG